MIDILNLALPFFGLILIGFVCGRWQRLPEAGLAWMNFFLLYVSLPALLFGVMSQTPFAELNNPPFIVATTLATATAFALSAILARYMGGLSRREAAMAGLAGSYGNIGYMGPGLAFAVLGPAAAAPTGLIFCCDNIFLFSAIPLAMALAGGDRRSFPQLIGSVLLAIVRNPLIVAAVLGTLAAAFHVRLPTALDNIVKFLQNAAAPMALFVLGVTVALRPFGGVPREISGIVAIKLIGHPLLLVGLLTLLGPFSPTWVATALLMASLPQALNVFVIARQYETWVEPASVVVLVGTFASFLTLTGMMWLIKTGALPL